MNPFDGPISLRQVWAQLQAEGLAALLPEPGRVPAEEPPAGSHWYVRLFAGLGAWTAALLLLAFLAISEMIQSGGPALAMGLIFCAVAIPIGRGGGDFRQQLGLSLSLLGQALFAVGLFDALRSEDGAAAGIICLELALLALYPDHTHRVISTLIIIAAGAFLLQPAPPHGLALGLAAIVVGLAAAEPELQLSAWRKLTDPVGSAAAFGLLAALASSPLGIDDPWSWISAVALLALLGGAGWMIAADLGRMPGAGQLALALLGALGLGVLSVRVPGVAAACLVLTLGFWRSQRWLMGIAAAFLVFSLGFFYYSLEATLLVKSYALLASGGALLALRWALGRIQEGATE